LYEKEVGRMIERKCESESESERERERERKREREGEIDRDILEMDFEFLESMLVN
jgi:hypothetical protein